MDYKKIKTFEDACKDQGKNINAVPDYSKAMLSLGEEKFNLAVFKLSRIAISLNKTDKGKEWKPGPGDIRYYPWLWWENDNDKPSGSGLSFYDCDLVRSYTTVASRLTFRTSAIAEYAFKQFQELYEDLIIFLE